MAAEPSRSGAANPHETSGLTPHSSYPTRFEAAIRRFDEENARDPHTELVNGAPQPRELVYAGRLTDWVLRLQPEASEALKLAARCQHLCRWAIPRSQYPMDRAGYLKWRTELKKFHAEKSGHILREMGYDDELVGQVQALNLKKYFPNDADSRVLEDALCLVFLQHQLTELAAKTDDAKMINALRKSWQKMTEQARTEALKLPYGPRETRLIRQALQGV